MHRLVKMTLRDLIVIGLPLAIIVVGAFVFTYQFVRPAPPKELTILTSGPEGSFQRYALRYKETFAANGITLTTKTSKGVLDNLNRLLDPKESVDVGFIQGGLTLSKETPGLVSLGVVYKEPIWLFYKGKRIDHLSQLKGKRIAIGGDMGGTKPAAMALLEAHGIDSAPTRLVSVGGLKAIQALQNGDVDATFIVAEAQSGAVWAALYTPGIQAFNYSQADAYAKRFSYISTVVVPRGAIDLKRDIPNQDLTLIATTAMLVARERTHPALIDLLLQAASQVHGSAGLFQKAGEFPSATGVEIPLSKSAERFYKSGKPFLQQYLPFWAAILIERLIILLVPLIAVLFPLIRVAPFLYSWRVRTRVFRYYGELKLLELQAMEAPEKKSAEEWIGELDRIEQAANRIPTPNAFADQVYTLRAHVQLVRHSLMQKLGLPKPVNA